MDGERGRNRTFNLLIKSHVGLNIYFLATHNEPITYTSLARTENSSKCLKRIAIFSNVQPQIQPHPFIFVANIVFPSVEFEPRAA